MYSKSLKITGNRSELSNYIFENDVYNASILVLLNDPTLERVAVEITTNQYRPDLIAEKFYGSANYIGFVVLQAARGLETYTKGSTIWLLKKVDLDNILKNI